MLDYGTLKALAKTIGRPVVDLLALAPVNDPFYAGSPQRRRDGEWFARLWADHGQHGGHLRRLHYQLISQPSPVSRPDGEPYANTTDDWQTLLSASLAARYLGLIPENALIDRRNDPPVIFDHSMLATREGRAGFSAEVAGESPSVITPAVPDFPPLPWLSLDCDEPLQDFTCEIWIEKSTQNDWLVPLCRARGVNLVVGAGEQSEIRSRELAIRAARAAAPVRVIYLSDFDPGGRSMPKATARKVEFAIAKLGLDVDLQLIPLVLTPEQCRQYVLPRTPIKETERRRDAFEQRFGVGATELDALEALHPGEMAKLLNAELDSFLDRSLSDRFHRKWGSFELTLTKIEKAVRAEHSEAIERLRARFDEMAIAFKEAVGDFTVWEDEAAELWGVIARDLEAKLPSFEGVGAPPSLASGETERFVLFDSRRSYLDQMDAYNAWHEGIAK
jgi:hypothetical protein